jgi:hypothetical protein
MGERRGSMVGEEGSSTRPMGVAGKIGIMGGGRGKKG